MMKIEDIQLSDMAEKIAEEYMLSTVLIIVVSRSPEGTQSMWGFEGSAYEALGAAHNFSHRFLHDEDKGDEL